MSAFVNTNVKSLAVQQALVVNQRSMDKSMAQLATGQRINSVSDDAAGLAIGNKMTAQIRSLDMAVRNANDGISMLQTADGATSEMTDMLIRMRELAIQSANDTNGQDERDALQAEFLQLQEQAANTVTNTSWNGMKLLKGEAGTAGVVKFHVGASSSDSIALPLAELNSNDVAAALGNSAAIDTRSKATASIDLIDKAMVQIDSERSQWGAMMSRLTYAADNASNVSMHTSASRSRIMDTDYAQATAELARSMILNEAGTAMLSQANQQPYYVLALLS
ncbi:MAG: flagellin FliC [Limnohabitans sp.]|nr:flagellin FliC [Limnohabitans sp.]